MKKLQLNNTTLIAIDTLHPTRSLFTLEQCKRFIDFAEVKFLTSFDSDYHHAVKIPQVIRDSTRGYSEFIYYDLNDYVDTEFVLICQWDGWVLDPRRFTDNFFQFDYIGPSCCWREYQNPRRITLGGNGGFSLRSKRLLEWSVCHKELFRLFENDEIYGFEDYVYSVMLSDVLRRDGFRISDRITSSRWGLQGGATDQVENAYRFECFGHHNMRCRLPLFPEYFEHIDHLKLDSVLYHGRCVTDIFLYYLPVWIALGTISVHEPLFDGIFATNGFYGEPQWEVSPEQRGLSIHCSCETYHLRESDSFDPKALFEKGIS